jgi:biopolymer transport protein TolR
MAYNPARPRKPMSQINVVPYIDVMLVLLVIFMVTAPLMQQAVEVDLPNAPSETVPPDTDDTQPVIVEVDKRGHYFVSDGNGRVAVEPNALAEVVAQRLDHEPKPPVYVGGDQEVDYGLVITALVSLRNAGVEAVGLLTEPLERLPETKTQ